MPSHSIRAILRHVAIGVRVASAAPDHHQAGLVQRHLAGIGIGAVHRVPHPRPGGGDHLRVDAQFAAITDLDPVLRGIGVQHGGNVVLGVHRGEQHARHRQDTRRSPPRAAGPDRRGSPGWQIRDSRSRPASRRADRAGSFSASTANSSTAAWLREPWPQIITPVFVIAGPADRVAWIPKRQRGSALTTRNHRPPIWVDHGAHTFPAPWGFVTVRYRRAAPALQSD